MTTLPTFSELYDEFKATLQGDPDHDLSDWSAGSWLDALGMVAAMAGRGVMRWVLQRFLSAFIATAEGDDLDYIIEDRLGLPREGGESDDDYRTRALEWVRNLARGTVPALRFWAEALDGVASVTITEDLDSGLVTITLTLEDGAVEAGVLATADAEIDEWRGAGHTVNTVAAS